MIQSIRELAHSWLFKSLMVVLVVSFGVWGIGDMFRGNVQNRVVARAGKIDITAQQVWRMFDRLLAQARQSFGPDFTVAQGKDLGLLNVALERLLEESILDQDIARLGIDVNDKTVFASLMARPQFHNKDGVFDPALLRQLVERANMSERAIMNVERQGIGRQILGDVFLKEALVSKLARDMVYRARAQKRAFDVVSIEHAAFDAGKVPDDSALRAYYQAHEKLFSAPEYRAITIASLSLADVSKDIAVSDDQIKEEYDRQGDRLNRPERRDIIQAVLQDEGKAQKLASDAVKNGGLAAAVKAYRTEAIPLKQVESKTLLPELSAQVFSLPKGGISKPIKSSLGWHVVQIVSIEPEGKPSLEEVRDSLRDSLKRDQAIEVAMRTANKIDDELAAGHSLEDIADALRLRLVKIPAVDISGNTPDGKSPAELPYKKEALRAAFAQNGGETSPIMDDKNGNSFVVRTDDVTLSGLKPFESVRDKVVEAWANDERGRLAGAEATKIANQLRDGKPLSALDSLKGVSVRVTEPMSLMDEGRDSILSAEILAQAFQLKKGDAKAIPAGDRELVVRLNRVVDVQDGDAGADSAKDKVSKALSLEVPQEISEEYMLYLKTFVFPVRVNRDALDAIAQRGE